MGEIGAEQFRRDLRRWFAELKRSPEGDNGYRTKLVIPKDVYKGLAWGLAWSATRILGPDDPDTVVAWKSVDALLRLSRFQDRRLKALLARVAFQDPSGGNDGAASHSGDVRKSRTLCEVP